jgi:hypothetical protein
MCDGRACGHALGLRQRRFDGMATGLLGVCSLLMRLLSRSSLPFFSALAWRFSFSRFSPFCLFSPSYSDWSASGGPSVVLPSPCSSLLVLTVVSVDPFAAQVEMKGG